MYVAKQKNDNLKKLKKVAFKFKIYTLHDSNKSYRYKGTIRKGDST